MSLKPKKVSEIKKEQAKLMTTLFLLSYLLLLTQLINKSVFYLNNIYIINIILKN